MGRRATFNTTTLDFHEEFLGRTVGTTEVVGGELDGLWHGNGVGHLAWFGLDTCLHCH